MPQRNIGKIGGRKNLEIHGQLKYGGRRKNHGKNYFSSSFNRNRNSFNHSPKPKKQEVKRRIL